MPKSFKVKEALRLVLPTCDQNHFINGLKQKGLLYVDFAETARRMNIDRKTRHLLTKENVDGEWNRIIDTYFPACSITVSSLKDQTSSQSATRFWDQFQNTLTVAGQAARRGLKLHFLGHTGQQRISYERFKREFEDLNKELDLTRRDYEVGLRASADKLLKTAALSMRKLTQEHVERLISQESEYWKDN